MCSSPVNSFVLAEHKIAVVLLAAGRGVRMGGEVPKLLLPMRDGRPMLLHALDNALALQPLQTIVVLRPDISPIVESSTFTLQPGTMLVTNPRYEEGMGTSLAVGVSTLMEWSPEAEACLVMLGDEPNVPRVIVEKLVVAYMSEKPLIAIPVYGEQPGPPTLFARDLFPQLARLEGDTGGRQLVARYPERVLRVEFNQADRPLDIDTPEDYRAHS
jgi:molybdenum cofactor cytidylyltransferase